MPTTFTILICSLQASASSEPGPKGAHTRGVHLLSLLYKENSTHFLVTQDLAEVCTVSSKDDVALRLNPYPLYY